MKHDTESGAAAVEFALVIPVLMLIVLAIIQFGVAFTYQISVTQAAREAVRSMAVVGNQATAVALAQSAYGLSTSSVSVPATCPAGTTITVTVKYTVPSIGNLVSIPLTGVAAMQCGG